MSVREFSLLQEFFDYVPNCIMCEKPMRVCMYTYNTGSKVSLEQTERFIVSIDKPGTPVEKRRLVINPTDNCVIIGASLLDSMFRQWVTVKKTCRTCNFSIQSYYRKGSIRYPKVMPVLPLSSETIEFRRKKGQRVLIEKTYQNEKGFPYEDRIRFIIGERQVVSLGFDDFRFDKIKNLKHLNRQIKTILTFQ